MRARRARLLERYRIREARVTTRALRVVVGTPEGDVDVTLPLRRGEGRDALRMRVRKAVLEEISERELVRRRGADRITDLLGDEIEVERPTPIRCYAHDGLVEGARAPGVDYVLLLIEEPGGRREIIANFNHSGRFSVALGGGARCISVTPVSPDGLLGADQVPD